VKSSVTALVEAAVGVPVSTLFIDQLQSAKRQSFVFVADALPDGAYVFRVTGRLRSGASETLERDFVVDRTLSAVAVSPATFSPNGDGRDDTAALSYALAGPAQVTVQVEQEGRVVAMLSTAFLEAGTHQAAWDGNTLEGPAPDGAYDLVVLAQTPLATNRQPVTVTLNRSA
jgi:hypothetical protein